MSSIQKIQRQSGMRYKAVLKRGDHVLKTKTFTKQQLARTWLKKMEADQETITALGLAGARKTLSNLITLIADDATRTTAEGIEAHLDSLMPAL